MPIELRRDELYERVWAEPVERLAAQCGISGRGLAKICRRLDIPVPPRGYWAQLQHGHNPTRLPLPPASRGASTTVTIRGDTVETAHTPTLPPDVLADIAREQQSEHHIRVPERIARFHPRVRATRAALHGATPDKYGLVHPFTPRDQPSRIPLLNIAVARSSVPRALRLVDTLPKALETRGFASQDGGVRMARPSPSESGNPSGNGTMSPRRRNSKSNGDGPGPGRRGGTTSQPALTVDEFTRARTRKRWSDWSHHPLEEQLNDVVAGMVLTADAKRRDEQERRRERERYEEAERRRLELERQRQEEEARRRDLHAQADRWASSQRLRRYLAAVEHAAAERGDEGVPRDVDQQWLGWARRYADEVDPLTSKAVLPETKAAP